MRAAVPAAGAASPKSDNKIKACNLLTTYLLKKTAIVAFLNVKPMHTFLFHNVLFCT
jgi:hypothetical protein